MSLMKASELNSGGIITESGNAESYNTGDWRTFVPKFVEENCIHCLFCWIWCPDSAIEIDTSGDKPQVTGIVFDHCKGCGICVHFCPKSVLELDQEEKAVAAHPQDCICCKLCEMRCPDLAVEIITEDDDDQTN